MFYYSIVIQFAKSDAPAFTDPLVAELIKKGIAVYNAKSLMAANPKQIIKNKIIDEITMEVILESTTELQESMASKALRVFSSYLIDENTENNLSELITGKRLFKMLPTKLEKFTPINEDSEIEETSEDSANEETEILEPTLAETVEIDDLSMIHQLVELLQESKKNTKYKHYAVRVRNVLRSWETRKENNDADNLSI